MSSCQRDHVRNVHLVGEGAILQSPRGSCDPRKGNFDVVITDACHCRDRELECVFDLRVSQEIFDLILRHLDLKAPPDYLVSTQCGRRCGRGDQIAVGQSPLERGSREALVLRGRPLIAISTLDIASLFGFLTIAVHPIDVVGNWHIVEAWVRIACRHRSLQLHCPKARDCHSQDVVPRVRFPTSPRRIRANDGVARFALCEASLIEDGRGTRIFHLVDFPGWTCLGCALWLIAFQQLCSVAGQHLMAAGVARLASGTAIFPGPYTCAIGNDLRAKLHAVFARHRIADRKCPFEMDVPLIAVQFALPFLPFGILCKGVSIATFDPASFVETYTAASRTVCGEVSARGHRI
mmetsp:Transcript_34486/g.87198  ORF Transcript_34486/g.87198 Transcript_34486/m.87198 type:complete len:350 (-) Transcript_34486:2982-4031(-)